MAVLALVLTTAPLAGEQVRRGLGLALMAGAGSLVSAVVAAASSWPAVRLPAGTMAAAFLVLALVKVSEYCVHRRRDANSQYLLQSLAGQLPEGWYLLGDLRLTDLTGEPLHAWGVVLGPGGLAVLQLCTDEGHLIPFGHVWMAGRGAEIHTIPSPAAHCAQVAEAIRARVGHAGLPVWPVVVLADLHSVYHPKQTGALVVGAPHAAPAIRRCLEAQALAPGAVLSLATKLSHFCG